MAKELTALAPSTIDIKIKVSVIEGHDGVTIMPVFPEDQRASASLADKIPSLDRQRAIEIISSGSAFANADERLYLKSGGSDDLLRPGRSGWRSMAEGAFMASTISGLLFFTPEVTFGMKGVKEIREVRPLKDHEKVRPQRHPQNRRPS